MNMTLEMGTINKLDIIVPQSEANYSFELDLNYMPKRPMVILCSCGATNEIKTCLAAYLGLNHLHQKFTIDVDTT